MDINEAKDLLQRYQNRLTSAGEDELVEKWYNNLIETSEWEWSDAEKEQLSYLMEVQLMNSIVDNKRKPVKRISMFRSIWLAASVIIIVLAGFKIYSLLNTSSPVPDKQIVKNGIEAPKINKAVLTLSDGSNVYLDSTGNGQFNQEGNINLIKHQNGELVYQASVNSTDTKVRYNSLFNPRGSKAITITLSDGTKVWLNAESSISFPVAFIESERKVSVTGEAYFEVAHDATHPFIVSKDEMKVQVLGTHFNVNTDQKIIKVTLLQGSVKVYNTEKNSIKLSPGQQAKIDGDIKVINKVDLDEVMAWKNGLFFFNNTSLRQVMQQLAQWYDMDIVYKGDIPAIEFAGEMERSLNLSEVLKILEKNGIHFSLDEKKIIVTP